MRTQPSLKVVSHGSFFQIETNYYRLFNLGLSISSVIEMHGSVSKFSETEVNMSCTIIFKSKKSSYIHIKASFLLRVLSNSSFSFYSQLTLGHTQMRDQRSKVSLKSLRDSKALRGQRTEGESLVLIHNTPRQ